MTSTHALPSQLNTPFIAYSVEYPNGHVNEWHCHNYAQLLYACHGVMVVNVPGNLWVSPPQRAIWVPPRVPHKVTMHGRAEMKSLYIRSEDYSGLPESSSVLSVSPLLRELLVHLSELPENFSYDSSLERLLLVTIDLLKLSPSVQLSIPKCTNKRLQPVCQEIMRHPHNSETLEQWSEKIHISSRTMSRLFKSELGMSFVQFRQQVRLVESLKRLASGEPVTSVAMNVGFASLSAFNRLFKNYFGTAPGQFFD
ncbi:AraC family transcriptional regulator [Endozoicomonas montiporae]|uniref:AraC family transcriptional regulator n=2 Tax=Endozoicomonas montiporae TaxID=1027273 RepID=A0A081MZ28_9GAMM|nr:helix-turn-helix transcriptional regulator [Endozoicomonas montiporae]AMO54925.1 AraC family transcriptional regulator [Endozoicomonas montiporae CL-33]KEQ11451.1 AraC family transcriptional regulator [Endozoicomonas montiporae]